MTLGQNASGVSKLLLETDGWMDFWAEFENLKFKTTGILLDGSAVVALQSILHIKAGCAELQGE